MKSAFLVFVTVTGTAIPLAIRDEEWLKKYKPKENKFGTYIGVLADSLAEAMIKAKEQYDGARV